jgi:hypothetical protein
MSQDTRIRGYFSKPEGICKQKCSGNPALSCSDSALIPTKHIYFCSIPGKGESIFFLKASRPALVSIQPPLQRVMGALFSRKESGWNVKLASYLHLIPRLRMSAAIPSLPHIPLHGVHGDTFTCQRYF